MPKTYPLELQQSIEHELESRKYRSEGELLVDALSLFREMKQRHDELRRPCNAPSSRPTVAKSSRGTWTAIKAELTQELDEKGQPR